MANERPKIALNQQYSPQLDGLRFCAVLFVVCYHWLPSLSEVKISYFFGGLVNFFFVLSSYLITQILFRAKERHLDTGVSKITVMTVFLLRRTIRIFPAYYVFLMIVILIPTIGTTILDHSGMYISYLANYQIYNEQTWPPVTSHIWTLAVEEQFYLAWPLVIIFIPYKHLLKSFLFLIAGSILFRAFSFTPAETVPMDILTEYCVDAFAVGGILAYKYIGTAKEKALIGKYSNILLYIAIPACIGIILSQSHYLSFVLNKFFFAVISMKVIEGAVNGYKNLLGKFLEVKTVLFLGRISYGIYLYHLLVPVVFWKLYSTAYGYFYNNYNAFFTTHQSSITVFQNIIASEVGCFIIYSLCAVGLAVCSWNFIEAPFSKLKVLLDYNKRKPTLKRLKQIISW